MGPKLFGDLEPEPKINLNKIFCRHYIAGAGAGAGAGIMGKSEPEPKINNFGSATLL